MKLFGGQGRRLDKASDGSVVRRRHHPDYQLVLYVGLLMLIGLVVMYAIGPQRANVLNSSYGTDFYTSTYFVVKQAVSLSVALAAFFIFLAIPYPIIKRYSRQILYAGLAACVILVITGNMLHIEAVAKCSLGACRWFELGFLGSFQPAELLKFGLLVFLAGFLSMRIQQDKINDVENTIIPMLITVGTALFFTVIVQKDMGTGISMIALVAAMLMVGGVNRAIGMKLFVAMVLAGIAMIVSAPHRMERVMTYIQGDNAVTVEREDAIHHIKQAKIAIGSGGVFGVGIGNSVQATGYLPEAINDSVFAIMGETFGFVGLIVILLIFTALLLRLLRIIDYLVDPWMRLVVAGAFGWVSAHIILNIASMLGVFPLTGITLPLLSFGGTSMVFVAAILGLVFQLSAYTDHHIVKETAYANTRSGRGVGRTRYAGRRRTS